MNRWKKLWYLGYDRTTIQKCRPAMDFDNVITVKSVSILLICILAILILFYTLFDNTLVRNMICIISALLLCGICHFANRMLKHPEICTPSKTDALINTLSFLCFAVGIYLGTFAAPNDLAVAPVWMFFFAVLIFNRLPSQTLVVLCSTGLVFAVCSYMVKSPHHFQYDMMHGITSIFASAFMSWQKSRMKVENILAMQRLENANLAILETVEEQEKEAQELRHQAQTDGLSGFYKKESFEKSVIDVLTASKDSDCHLLVCSDIDNFKNINDCFGHKFGDDVLREMVNELVRELGTEHLYGRFGGDEFMILIQNVDNPVELLHRINHLEECCRKTYSMHGIRQTISLSTGVAFFPQDGRDYSSLFEAADAALYASKREKKALR